jgi:hypothetical protein
MANVPRPLIALLVATVAVAALWVVALKPSSSSSGGGSQGASTYKSAVNKAHQAVAISNQASAAHGGTVATSPAATPQPSAAAAPKPAVRHPARSARVSPSTLRRLNVVERALSLHKVIALLFYNPAAADDQAVRRELAAVPGHGGAVVKLAVPLRELSRYAVVANQVPVNSSPTLVLIDREQRATTLVGFADGFEILNRVADALAAR